MTRLQFVLLSTCALFACRVQQPSTVVPEAPRITSFTASSVSLDAPGTVTLSWETSNTTGVQLSSTEQAELAVPEDRLSGAAEVQIQASTILVLVARGPGGTDTRAVTVNVAGAPPSLTLVALPPVVAGGDTVTLAWTAPGARSIALAAGSEPLDARGQVTSGALVLRPSRDTVYTLTADDGRSASTTVTVQVGLLSLEANPAAAQVGDDVTVSWKSAGADRVIVSSPGRGQLAEITDAARVIDGSFVDVVPQLPTDGVLTYEVSAFHGTERMTRTTSIFVGSQLSIVRFDAPEVARAGAPYFVRWNTLAATRAQVRVEGQLLYETPSLNVATAGAFSFAAPAGDFEVTLVALDDRGGSVSRSAQVDSVGIPNAATLTAAPASIASGDAVRLEFTAAEARRVRITDALGHAVFSTRGQGAEAGSVTVFPTESTTYTLRAENLLGDPAVSATASVTVTGPAPTVRQFPPTAISGQNVELQASAAGALYSGFPHDSVLTSSTSNFLDISATGERVLEQGGDATSVVLPFSTRLWGELKSGPLTISRSGWMAWGAPLVAQQTEPPTLPSTAAASVPGVIAPFWDDLRLTAQSAVYVQVVGEAPEERLIVQWDKLQMAATDPNSLATFQVQVQQSGAVSFHYDTMIPHASPVFVVGLQDSTRLLGFDLFGNTPPASNTSVYFFSPLSVPPSVRVQPGTSWGGFVKVGSSSTFVTRPALTVRVPNDLAISELMFRPSPGLVAGQYVEAVNLTATSYDLSGWVLRSNDGSSFTLPAGSTLPANGQLLLGASLDPAENGDAGVTVSWSGSGFSLGVDAGVLTFGTTDAGYSLTYSGQADGGRGTATEIDPGPFVAVGQSTPSPATCLATRSFGAQLGTPGANGGCAFAYQRQGTTNRFHDISSTGTVLLAPVGPVIDQLLTVTLAPQATDPAPRLFGARAATLYVSTNGWVSPRATTSAGSQNKNFPSNSPEPVGTIAPFWDALRLAGGVSTLHWQKFETGEDPLTPERHWIVQWTHFGVASAGPNTPDDVTFQVKLFEGGDIEFHYAEMRSGTTSRFGEGGSATIWVEDSTARALFISANTPAPLSNTALRFVAR